MNDLPANVIQTYPLHIRQLIAAADDIGSDFGDMQAEIAPGESVQFRFVVCLSNYDTGEVLFNVKTPVSPNGGFQVAGTDFAGTFNQLTYGADYFNTAVGAQRGGVPGSLLGYDVHVISGNLANGKQPGLLKLAISGAVNVHIEPGSLLEVRRIGNARDNEVGA